MISWREEGLLIGVRRHGESAAIVDVLTREHGRHTGVVRGGASRKIAPTLQPGNQVDATWSARLEDHMGAFVIEPVRSRAAGLMDNRLALAASGAICALLCRLLPERQAHADLYDGTVALFDVVTLTEDWPLAYLQWEMNLLEALGSGLDLGRCAVSGSAEDLVFVSPKTGRAVSRAGAGDWAPKLLPLPPVMRGQGEASNADVALALGTTGYFLERLADDKLPSARDRLLLALQRAT